MNKMNKTMLGGLALAAAFLSGCSNAEYKPLDNSIYINGAAADPLRIITVGDANSTTSILVRSAAPAKQTITVNLAVQQSALDAYNKRNDANYVLLPAEFYTLSATSLKIEQGKVSTPELTVTIKPFTEELSKSGKKYAIPLSIVSVLMFTDLGVGKEDVTFWTSLLVLPWSLKPLFSLCMELFGTKRQYVFLTEAITALMFGLVCFALPLPSFFSIALAFMGVLAISGSMHDIAGDGLYMQELSSSEQGVYAGWQGAFYNLAKILTNGGLVYLAGYLSKGIGLEKAWMVIMAICAGLMLALSLYHMWVLPKETAKERRSAKES